METKESWTEPTLGGARESRTEPAGALRAPGTERALERTLRAPGTERALERTLRAPGTEQALERTLRAPGTERALERTLRDHTVYRGVRIHMQAFIRRHGQNTGRVEQMANRHIEGKAGE